MNFSRISFSVFPYAFLGGIRRGGDDSLCPSSGPSGLMGKVGNLGPPWKTSALILLLKKINLKTTVCM